MLPELVMTITSIGMTISAETIYKYNMLKEKTEVTQADWNAFDAHVNMNSKFTPQISFRQFGKGENHAVIPGLQQLGRYVRDVINLFTGEF